MVESAARAREVGSSERRPGRHALAAIVLAVGIASTVTAWQYQRRGELIAGDREFEVRSERLTARLDERLSDYAEILRGVAALFEAGVPVSRRTFQDYVAHLEVDRYYPGVRSFVYAAHLTPEQLPAASRQGGALENGVHPAGRRDDYVIIEYLAPQTPAAGQGLGFDLLSEPRRRAALERARDGSTVSMTEHLTLLSDAGDQTHPAPGVLMLLPVHRRDLPQATIDERRRATLGYVVTAFRVADLLESLRPDLDSQHLAVRIYDGPETQANLLFDSDPGRWQNEIDHVAATTIAFGGRSWNLRFADEPGAPTPSVATPSSIVLPAGFLTSILVSLLVWYIVTARGRAEAEAARITADLQSALARNEAVIDNTPIVSIIGMRRDGTVFQWNPASERLFGYTRKQIVGRRIQEVVGEAGFPLPIEDGFARVWSSGQGVAASEWPLRLPDGRSQWLLTSIFPVAGSGTAVEAFAMSVDISHRKASEEALRESEMRLRRFFEVGREGLMFHEDGVIVDANDALAKLVCVDSGEALRGRKVLDFIVPTERDLVRSKIADAAPAVYQTWAIRCGERIAVEVSSDSYQFGGRRYRVAAVRNISEQRRQEDALRASEARVRAVIEFSPLPILVAEGGDGRITRVNRKFTELFGYGESDLARLDDWWRLGIPDASIRKAFLAAWTTPASREAGRDAEIAALRQEMVCRIGERRWVDVFTAVHGEATIITLIDVTERQRIEAELIRHRDHLQEMVESRTADLLRAKDAAERANLAKSEFLANMSHELRTPLHAILSFAHLGDARAATLSPPRLREYFLRIAAAGDRLLSLVDDLLDLAKLESGRAEFRPEPVDLAEQAREVLTELESLALAKSLHVHVESTASDSVAWADRHHMAQVLRNLLGNAIKFSPPSGTIRIVLSDARVSAGPANESADALALEVSDQGMGIPEGELERIFDKFAQSSRTRTGAGGTGLGLAICRDILDRHHGSIRARNNLEGGATLSVVLPRNKP
jgi:PAS domain S-box-containing protein